MNNKDFEIYLKEIMKIFEQFHHDVSITRNRSKIWHFTTLNSKQDKKYCVSCIQDYELERETIENKLPTVPKSNRLVVVCPSHTPQERELADQKGYCLVSFDLLQEFGEEMITIKSE